MSVHTVLAKMREDWLGLVIIVLAVGVGWSVRDQFVEHRDLPDRMENVEQAIVDIRSILNYNESFDQRLALLEDTVCEGDIREREGRTDYCVAMRALRNFRSGNARRASP